MSAPNPNALADTIARIIQTLSSGVEVGEGRPFSHGGSWHRQSMVDAYRWMHGAAYAARAGGESTSTLCGKCGGTGWVTVGTTGVASRDRVRCEACTPRTLSDPTGEIVANQQALRDQLDQIGKLAERALDAVLGMVSGVQAAVGAIDRGVSRELPNERGIPRTATKAEVDAARAAQGRRDARGEGVA